MKIALILTGHHRGFRSCYNSIKEFILDKHDTDIFISTWNINNPGRSAGHGWENSNSNADLSLLKSLYLPKKIKIINHDDFYRNRYPPVYFEESMKTRPDDVYNISDFAKQHGGFWIERLRDIVMVVKIGYELIDNPKQYDLIVRIRLDLKINQLILRKTNNLVVPSYWSYLQAFGNSTPNKTDTDPHPYALCDRIAYGPPDKMKTYCLFEEHVVGMYLNNNDDLSRIDSMLGRYLILYNNINVEFDEILFSFCPN